MRKRQRVMAAALCRVGTYVVGIGGTIGAVSSPPAESGEPAAIRLLLLLVAVAAGAIVLHLAARLLEGD